MSWRDDFRTRLPILGHRNWILIADAAYPEQCAPGIATLSANEPLPEALAFVMSEIQALGHVRADAFLDLEFDTMPALSPEAAPLLGSIVTALDQIPRRLPHEQLLADLSLAAQTYRVFVIKTPCRIPYSSVFLRLECGYWSPDQEAGLRALMRQI